MKAELFCSGVKNLQVVVHGDATISVPDGERLESLFTELDSRSGIKEVRLGEAKEGDLWLWLTMEDGSSETFRVSSQRLLRCGTADSIKL